MKSSYRFLLLLLTIIDQLLKTKFIRIIYEVIVCVVIHEVLVKTIRSLLRFSFVDSIVC
jgi:hypothetical protein